MNTSSERPAIIFLHIPKSGGTTMHTIIERQYPPDRIFTIDGQRVPQSIAEFKALPAATRARLQVLKGHMAFGLHAWLPQPATYFTLLRHPVERAISHYYHILRSPHHTHHAAVAGGKMDLQAFVEAGVSRIVDNGQVRALAAAEETPYGQCTAAMLAQAEANIAAAFDLVGLTERFDETLVLLKQRYGWRIGAYRRQNIGANRPPSADVPPAAWRLLEELNQFDIQLYEQAAARLDQAVARGGARFAVDVRRLQWRNALRSRYRQLVLRLRSI